MGKELPPGVVDQANKHLAWDRLLGENSPTSVKAFELSQKRTVNTHETDVEDWLTAEEEVREKYIQEFAPQLA
jgi:hypothetical protein